MSSSLPLCGDHYPPCYPLENARWMPGASRLSSKHLPVGIIYGWSWHFCFCFAGAPSNVVHYGRRRNIVPGDCHAFPTNMLRALMLSLSCWMQGSSRWMPMAQCRAEHWISGRACWMLMLGRALDAGQHKQASALWMPIQGSALCMQRRALDAGTIWQHIQGYICAFWAAIATNNMGHCSMPAYGGTVAATPLCPSSAAAQQFLWNPSSARPGAGLGEHEIL